jgi:hypothetical protein
MTTQLTADCIGICVQVSFKLDRNGNTKATAKHKRDTNTTYRLSLQTKDPLEVLAAWMTKFTGKDSQGFTADFKVVARGGDHQGYYYVLVPTHYN